MGAYSRRGGAYLQKLFFLVGAYSRGGLIRAWGLFEDLRYEIHRNSYLAANLQDLFDEIEHMSSLEANI